MSSKVTSISGDSPFYCVRPVLKSMYYFRQGYCLIFDNDKFDDHLELSNRAGSAEDRQLMEAVFTEQNFQVSFKGTWL